MKNIIHFFLQSEQNGKNKTLESKQINHITITGKTLNT